ncbi:Synaptobrevin-like protein, partial [Clonorchis sinensis]
MQAGYDLNEASTINQTGPRTLTSFPIMVFEINLDSSPYCECHEKPVQVAICIKKCSVKTVPPLSFQTPESPESEQIIHQENRRCCPEFTRALLCLKFGGELQLIFRAPLSIEIPAASRPTNWNLLTQTMPWFFCTTNEAQSHSQQFPAARCSRTIFQKVTAPMNLQQGETPRQLPANKRLQQTQAQVDEVVDIMRTNVEKVLERDQKLSQLDDRADVLQAGASQFEASAGKLKRKFWMKNIK